MRLLLSLAPVVAFYLLEERVGLRAAIVASLALAALEIAWTRWSEGRWSRLTLASAALIGLLGGLSLASDDPAFVLYAPAMGDLAFAILLIGGELLGLHPLTAALREQDPELDIHPLQERFLSGIAWRVAINFLLHAALVAWAAGESRETWLLVTGPVQFGMMAVQVAAEVAWGRLIVLPKVEAAEAAAWQAEAGRSTQPESPG